MTSLGANINTRTPYLRVSRDFPADADKLSSEINKTYIDIANAVNNRTISIFPTNRPFVTGESYYFTNQRQQTLRQVYDITSTSPIPHGLTLSQISRFTRTYGNFTDSTKWYGFISGCPTAIAGQIVFSIDSTNIVFTVGAGAPTLTSGQIILEWAPVVQQNNLA